MLIIGVATPFVLKRPSEAVSVTTTYRAREPASFVSDFAGKIHDWLD